MKQNEYFVFPNEATGFIPTEVNLMDEANYDMISPNLYRVQTISKIIYDKSIIRDYLFRHHLETTVERIPNLKGITYKQLKSLPHLKGIVKVRINAIGKIVAIGEYD